MSRLYGFLLSSLLVVPACESEPSVADDVDAVVAATADVAVFFCECSLEADGKDTDACAEAADDILGADVNECIEGVVAMDPSSQAVMRCTTAALQDLLGCYESEAICPEATASSSTELDDEEPATEEDEPISDDACGLAFEDEIKACGELPAETEDALDGCLPGREAKTDDCGGEEC